MRVQLRIAGGGRPSPAAARSGTLDRPQIASLAQRTPHVAAPGDGRPPLRGATVNSEMHQSHARHSAATQLRQLSPQETGPRFQQKCCKRRFAAAKAWVRGGCELVFAAIFLVRRQGYGFERSAANAGLQLRRPGFGVATNEPPCVLPIVLLLLISVFPSGSRATAGAGLSPCGPWAIGFGWCRFPANLRDPRPVGGHKNETDPVSACRAFGHSCPGGGRCGSDDVAFDDRRRRGQIGRAAVSVLARAVGPGGPGASEQSRGSPGLRPRLGLQQLRPRHAPQVLLVLRGTGVELLCLPLAAWRRWKPSTSVGSMFMCPS